MPVCCTYRQPDGGTAVGCYDRDECPEIEGLTLVDSREVEECPDDVADCFPEAKKNDEVRLLT